MNSIEKILKQKGPSLSSEIAEILQNVEGISKEAARKRISRMPDSIKRLKGISFPNRESFIFLEGQFGNIDFYENLTNAFIESNSAYGRAILGLKARNGIIKRINFSIASGLPIFFTKGQLLHEYVEKKLIDLGVLLISESIDGQLIKLKNISDLSNRRQAVLKVESIVLSTVRIWLTKLGITSFNVTAIRDDVIPKFGPFNWDIVGPSYLSGLTGKKEGKITQGYVVGDIILDKEIQLSDLIPFFYKTDLIRNQKNQKRFVAMFIADLFAPDALNELRRRGFLVATPENLFGAEIAKLLKELVNTIEHAAAAIVKNPDAVFKLIGKISKIEGASYNLRSVILELIIGRLFTINGYQIQIRQLIRDPYFESAEIDIKAVKDNEVICIECKAKAPGNLVNKDEIEEWINTSYPRIKGWLKNANTLPSKRAFHFYSSTDYSLEAKVFISQLREIHKRQAISFYNGQDIIKFLGEQKQNSLVTIFKEHFKE